MKSVPKANFSFSFYHLLSFTELDRKVNITKEILKQLALFLLLFSNFLSLDSRMFIFFVFCFLSNKLNSISCGICLSFKSRHLDLFCEITILPSSTGIFLGLWSRGPSRNSTEQLFFSHSCEWLLPII